jgi:hypothetical protein
VSCERGWILLALCLGSFQPSENFGRYVREFIAQLNEPMRETLMERFDRCASKGTRRQPPSYLEFQVSIFLPSLLNYINNYLGR